jgi:dephospho-CoA kinase
MPRLPEIITDEFVFGKVRPVPMETLMQWVPIIGVTGFIGSGKSFLSSEASKGGKYVHLSVDKIIADALCVGGPLVNQAARIFGPDVIANLEKLMLYTGYNLDTCKLSDRLRVDKPTLIKEYFDKKNSGHSKVWDNVTYDYIVGVIVGAVMDIAAARNGGVVLVECAMASFFERLSHESVFKLSHILSVVREKDVAVQSAAKRSKMSSAEVLARYADQQAESDLILSGSLEGICSQHANDGQAMDIRRFVSTLDRIVRHLRSS